MSSLILRITIAILVAILLATAGVKGNAAVLQTLFTVLGIVFSISMSLLVSFNLSKILNKKIRKELRYGIFRTRNTLLYDFGLSTIISAVVLTWDEDCLRYNVEGIVIDITLIGVALVAASLIFEIYNFRQLHKLHTKIEDAVIEEETNKAERML